MTIVFVDLAGFTALTETHGDDEAADLVERFVGVAREAAGPEDRLVKSMGDAVMLVSPGPRSAIGLVTRLLVQCNTASDFPRVRGGIHHGSVTRRDDDYFGAAVNLAARVASEAAGGHVLATEPVATVAREIGTRVVAVGARSLRNIASPVALFELVLVDVPHDQAVDPVCRMQIERSTAAAHLRHDGRDWYFCSLACVESFARDTRSTNADD